MLAPLVVVLAVGILVLFPVLAVVTGVFGLAARFARHGRMRSLRLLLFAVSWLAAETVALRPANAPDPSARRQQRPDVTAGRVDLGLGEE